MFTRSEYDDDDLIADRRENRTKARHWCSVCLGHTGPGSPCAPDVEPEDEEPTPEDEE